MSERIARHGFLFSEQNFLIHTYLSVFAKLLAYAVVSNDDYIDNTRSGDAPHLVLYNSSARDANATVVKREDLDLEFIVESKTYVYAAHDPEEAYSERDGARQGGAIPLREPARRSAHARATRQAARRRKDGSRSGVERD